jgi:hypothetical protein
MSNKKSAVVTIKDNRTGQTQLVIQGNHQWTDKQAWAHNAREHLKRLDEMLRLRGYPGLSCLRLVHCYVKPNDEVLGRRPVYAEVHDHYLRQRPNPTAEEQTTAFNESRTGQPVEIVENQPAAPRPASTHTYILGSREECLRFLSFNPGLEAIDEPEEDEYGRWILRVRHSQAPYAC